MASRIEQLIDEIEEFIDKCKFQPLSSTKIIVNKEELEEYLRELRLKTPEEIKRYQKIIANKDAILADAKAKADQMLEETQIRTNELVSEHEIMQQAYTQANDIVEAATSQAQDIIDQATAQSNAMKEGAMSYSDDMLANLEGVIGRALETYTSSYDSLISGLQDNYEVVKSNRKELNASNRGIASTANDSGLDLDLNDPLA